MTTLVHTWALARDRLRAAGVDSPVLDARMLVEAGAEVTRMDIVTDPQRILSEHQLANVDFLVTRREQREPISHILGKKAFWTIELKVTPDVLTPRPETETVVEVALERFDFTTAARVLDLGVGSGAILFAILTQRPISVGVGIDASTAALDVARENASALGLAERTQLLHGHWGAGLADGGYDLIVSNPPYIRSGAIDLLAPEVAKHEPRLALDGGQDGLACYRLILPEIARLLKPGASFVLEIGEGQAEAVWALADLAGLQPEDVRKDLAGISRVVSGRSRATG